MPAPIDETTSQLVERARGELARKLKDAETVANRGTLAFWGGAPIACAGALLLSSGAQVSDHGSYAKWSGATMAIVGGLIAAAVLLCLYHTYMRRAASLRAAESTAQRLHWLESQAREGLLTDAEIRAEVLQVMR